MATRRERVVLDLQDDLTPGLLRAAAAAELLNTRIDALSKNASRSRSANRDMASGVDDVERSASKAEKSLDKYTGRLGLLADAAITLGPALVPLGAVGIPAVTGLASSFGFAAVGAGTAILAFQGVGDALKAMNKAHLEPTTANLQAAQLAMDKISPSAQGFVKQLRSMNPELERLRAAAGENMFPGLTEGLKSLETVFPKIQRIMGAVGGELGSIGADAGQSLASPRWASFFTFLENEAPKALHDLAAAVGNVAHAAAQMWMAFAPLNNDFSGWMVKATGDLDKWATGLSKTQGFADFIDYVHQSGPQVGAALAAIGNAFVQIVQAAAPIGGPVLQALTALANVIAKVADSDLGTPIMAGVIAMRLWSRAALVASSATETAFGSRAVSSIKGYGNAIVGVTSAEQRASRSVAESNRVHRERMATLAKGAGTLALLGVATTGVADKFGLANTASLALMGTLIEPGLGTAFGATAGLALDLAHANDTLAQSTKAANLAAETGNIDQMTLAYARLNDQLKATKTEGPSTLSRLTKLIPVVGTYLDQFAGHEKSKAISQGQKALNNLEASKDNSLRNRGAEQVNGALYASNQLAARGFQLTAAGAREAAGGLAAFTAAATRANNAISHGNAWDSYRQSILDAKDAIEKSGKTLRGNGDIIKGQGRDMERLGLASRGTLRTIASGALQTAEGIKDTGKHIKFLDNARSQFIGIARAMGASGPAARRMANDFGLVNGATRKSASSVTDLNSKIRALKSKIVDAKAKGAKESSAEVQALRAQIAALKAKQVAIKEQGAEAAAQRVHDLQAAIAQLNGKTVTVTTIHNDRYHKLVADGGYISGPGGPRDDKIPAMLSNGEFVVNAHATARNLELLHQINAERFADGGEVAGRRRHNNGGGGNNNDHPHRHHHDENHKHVNKFVVALNQATKSLDKEKAARDALISKRNDLSGTVRDKFLTDPFAGGNVWAAGGGNPLGILKADISKANAFKSVLFALKKSGLHGDALASIASTGDMGQARALLSLGKGGLAQYEKLFDQRARAAGAVGNYAGNAAYGAAIARDNHELKILNAHVKSLEATIKRQHKQAQKNHKANADHTAKGVSKGVNKAASTGTRGSRGRR